MIEKAVNRSLTHLLSGPKILLTGSVLLACGLLFAFFGTFSLFASSMMQKSLFLIPAFISLGLLLSLGSLICKLYMDEISKPQREVVKTLDSIWIHLLSAPYFFIPFLALFALLWIGVGIFELLTWIPYLGPLLSSLFAFVPFVIHFSLYSLIALGVFGLFLFPPIMASTVNRSIFSQAINHFQQNPYRNIVHFLIAIGPALLLGFLGYRALQLCSFCTGTEHPLLLLLQNISFTIPFALLFIIPTIFFFQFGTESLLLIQNLNKESFD